MILKKNDEICSNDSTCSVEEAEPVVEQVTADSAPLRVIADDYAYLVKQLIAAGLTDYQAYEILKLVIKS